MSDLENSGAVGQGSPDWIEWAGGECPVPGDTIVATKHRCGDEGSAWRAGEYSGAPCDWWKHEPSFFGNDMDIIAYRLVSPTLPAVLS